MASRFPTENIENDIEDVSFEMGRRIEKTQAGKEETKKSLKTLESKIESGATFSTNHLRSVRDEVKATYDGKLKRMKDKARDEIRLINEEADEDIPNINENREKRIKACKEQTEKEQLIIMDSQAKLISDIETIDEKVKNKLKELGRKNQHNIDILNNMDSKIERIKQDDKTLTNEAPQVIASLDEMLSSNQEVSQYLDRIEWEVQRVKFVEGEVAGEHYGRIDGYIGKWEHVKSVDIPSIVNKPSARGFINDDKVVLDSKNKALYVTNISTEHTEKVIEGGRNTRVTSCASIDSNVIVCGKWRRYCKGDSFDRCITLYDRQWKVIRDIAMPRNTSSVSNTVYVDVDGDGMIHAAQYDQSNIYVINPADGKIVNTITMQDKKVWGTIQALSSGDAVVQTNHNAFIVISQLEEEKSAINQDQWRWPTCNCYVDKLTDTLFIRHQDKDCTTCKICAVDQVSCDGTIQASRVVEYKQSDRSHFLSPCLVTPSGNLVACDGNKLLLYRKIFTV